MRDEESAKNTPVEFAEIDSCHSLFLRELTEPSENSLRLLMEEAVVLEEEVTVEVCGVEIAGGRPVRSVGSSRLFEVIWDRYVAYSVRNESYVARDISEEFSGRFALAYSKSHFMEFVSRSTFANADYPGPLQHFGFICEMHVVDIISTEAPRIRQIRPRPTMRVQ
jgi:hypothetical protein